MTWETFLVLTDDNIVSPNIFFLHLILFYTQKKLVTLSTYFMIFEVNQKKMDI